MRLGELAMLDIPKYVKKFIPNFTQGRNLTRDQWKRHCVQYSASRDCAGGHDPWPGRDLVCLFLRERSVNVGSFIFDSRVRILAIMHHEWSGQFDKILRFLSDTGMNPEEIRESIATNHGISASAAWIASRVAQASGIG